MGGGGELSSHLCPCSRGSGRVEAGMATHCPETTEPERRKWCVFLWLSLRARPVPAQGQTLPPRNRNEAKWSPGLHAWEGNPSSVRTSVPRGIPGHAGMSGQRIPRPFQATSISRTELQAARRPLSLCLHPLLRSCSVWAQLQVLEIQYQDPAWSSNQRWGKARATKKYM